MAAAFTNYNVGGEGVNLVKNPLQLSDGELTQAQNAELVPDESKGGEGALSKRSGLGALNGSALAGSVLGAVSLPLQTTFTRKLVAFAGSADADTVLTTLDGTTWTQSAVPLRHATYDQFTIVVGGRYGSRRVAGLRSTLLYPGSDYTVDTTFPPVNFWDGANTGELLRIPAGPTSDGTAPGMITDMLVANGRVYIACLESPRTGAPDLRGSVHELNLDTGVLRMVGNGFGPTGITGGFPSCLAWYQGRLWAGVCANNSSSGTDHGKLVSCQPSIDSTWTAEGLAFNGYPTSLCEYLGDLFIGTLTEDATAVAGVVRRASATGAYTQSYSALASGNAHVTSLTTFADGSGALMLYGLEYQDAVTDLLHVKKFDGTSWTTDLDVDSAHSAVITTPFIQRPGNMIVFGGKLYAAFAGHSVSDTDGFILQKTSGVWTRVVDTESLTGTLGVLLERS